MAYVEPGYGGQLDLGIFSQRYDPNLVDSLQRQILIARKNFQNALAERHNSMYQNQLGMLGDELNASQSRVIASPFARSQNLIRF